MVSHPTNAHGGHQRKGYQMSDCNTKEGIENWIKVHGYKGLYEIFKVRRDKPISPKRVGNRTIHSKGLDHFVVLGRFALDHMGNVFRLNRELFTDDDRTRMPTVMTREEYTEYCAEHHPKDMAEHANPGRQEKHEDIQALLLIAPPHIVCAKCGKNDWGLENCHNIESEGVLEPTELTMFAGKTIREVKEEFTKRTDAEFQFSQNVREVNQFAFPDDHVIQPDDVIIVLVTRYYHASCYVEFTKEEGQSEEEKWNNLLSLTMAGPND